MDRRRFLQGVGGVSVVGASGAAGWALRDANEPTPHEQAVRLERDDATGLPTGGAGAFGIHRIIYSVPVDQPYVGITFDDGPDPEFTPRILEILKTYKITATFNMMGWNAIQHTDILREVVAAGHEIGNHTWTHRDLSTVGAVETAYEIHRGREVIEDLTKRTIRFFRPPRGEMNGAALRLVAAEGNDILMWSITGSVRGREQPAEVNRFVLDHLEPGAIIDFHDGIGRGTFNRTSPGARSLIQRRTAEVAGLPKLIEAAMAKGYTFMSVGELLTHEITGKSPTMTTDESPDADADSSGAEPDATNPPDATAPPGN